MRLSSPDALVPRYVFDVMDHSVSDIALPLPREIKIDG